MLAAPMTELEAVNDMLIGIGQLPVNAIIPEIVDQSIALGELNKVVREVCLYGFKFNTDEDYVLSPDSDGFIAVPTGALDIDPMEKAQDIIVRKHPTKGFGLWDAANLTWTMALPVKVRIKWSYTFDALPEAARGYAVIAAGRKFTARVVGDPAADRFGEEDQRRAWLTLQRQQSASADINIFRANKALAASLNRRGRAWRSDK